MSVPPAIGFWTLQAHGFIWLIAVVFWICGLVDLMTKRPDLDGRHRAAWLLLIILLPVLGTLLYFFLRPVLPAERDAMIAAGAGMPDARQVSDHAQRPT
jgi:Phospholipase_D-nuclease N-terminal